jgi:hypothetical protein
MVTKAEKTAGDATEQNVLHLIGQVPLPAGEHVADKAVDALVDVLVAKGAAAPSSEAPEEFAWNSKNTDVIIPQQGAIAVYSNPMGVVVIRQEANWDDEGDHFVFVHPTHIDAVVDRLMIYKAQAEQTIEERRLADLRERGL